MIYKDENAPEEEPSTEVSQQKPAIDSAQYRKEEFDIKTKKEKEPPLQPKYEE